MENQVIYAVIRYPKQIKRSHSGGEFHTYTTQSSNKKKMLEYYHEIKNRYPAMRVHLVTRETAKAMSKKWREMVYEKDKAIIADFRRREGV